MKKLLAVSFFLFSALAEAQITYTYTLPIDCTNVTVGIKDSTGSLIRTLQPAGVPRNAGTYTGTWDGLRDDGTTATGGPFTIVVLYGNPSYIFNGLVGDTSKNLTGWERWNMFSAMAASTRIVFVNGRGWAVSGFNEGTQSVVYFSDSEPNIPYFANITYGMNNNILWSDVASDGQFLYLANKTNGINNMWSFVTKLDATTGQPAIFSDPSLSVCTPATFTVGGSCNGGMLVVGQVMGAASPGGNYAGTAMPGVALSEIDVTPSVTAGVPSIKPPTSIAVQQVGSILAVGHGNYLTGAFTGTISPPPVVTNNDIKFFDKGTGLALGLDATLTNPTSMAFSSAGLWVVGDGVLSLVSNPSGTNTISHPITSLSYPMAVEVGHGATNTDHIYVLDGGTSQQLKEFDASYNLVRNYGVPGGYTDCNPTVADNRLMLDSRAITGQNGANPTWGNVNYIMPSVRVENNGDVWLSDNFQYTLDYAVTWRLQHLTISGSTYSLVAKVLKSGMNYNVGISHTPPFRLFTDWLEYQVNWDTPNPAGAGNWTLVKDWLVGMSGACGSSTPWAAGSAMPQLQWTEQMSNGHFYASVLSIRSQPVTGQWIIELPQNGTSPARFIGTAPAPGWNGSVLYMSIDRNGDIHGYTNTGTGPGSTQNLWVRKFTGNFDTNNNPIWATTNTLLQSVTYNQANQPTMANYPGQNTAIPANEPTLNGVYPGTQWTTYFSRTGGSTNYKGFPHTAGILPGRSTYAYMTNPEICSTFHLINGSYPCSAGSGNLGSGTFAEGHQFFVIYGSQTSLVAPQFWHYWEDGMFVGQFGGWNTNSWSPVGPNYPMYGNTSIYTASGNFPRLTLAQAAVGWRGAAPQLQGYVENVGIAKMFTSSAGNIYLVMANEGYYTPITIWQIGNTSSIQELQGTGTSGQSGILTLDQKVDMLKAIVIKERVEERREERRERRKGEK